MTTKDMVKAISRNTGFSQTDIRTVINVLRDVVIDQVKDCGEVKMFSGLSIYGVERPEHTGRNPKNGEPITVPSRVMCKLKVGRSFKDEIN